MKKTILCILYFTCTSLFSQAIYKTLYSQILKEERQVKILLPRGYSQNDDKAYPVIYVLDADYLFEVVAGNVDYYSYWKEIPDCIVVGVNQSSSRDEDLYFSGETNLPYEKGAKFFEYFGNELVSFIENTFKTVPFKAAIGHGLSANFINYYLLREPSHFNAYVTLSPDFAPNITKLISDRASDLKQTVFYYMAVSDSDVSFIKEETSALHQDLNALENSNFLYTFSELEDISHYTMPTHAIPKALDAIFYIYKPISKKEFQTTVLKLDTSPIDYLKDKYKKIKTLYHIEKTIQVNDFRAIEAAIKNKKQWDYLEDLSKLARKQYPNTILYPYYQGMYYEKIGKAKKAMKIYRDAYILEPVDGISKDDLINKANSIKIESESSDKD